MLLCVYRPLLPAVSRMALTAFAVLTHSDSSADVCSTSVPVSFKNVQNTGQTFVSFPHCDSMRFTPSERYAHSRPGAGSSKIADLYTFWHSTPPSHRVVVRVVDVCVFEVDVSVTEVVVHEVVVFEVTVTVVVVLVPVVVVLEVVVKVVTVVVVLVPVVVDAEVVVVLVPVA